MMGPASHDTGVFAWRKGAAIRSPLTVVRDLPPTLDTRWSQATAKDRIFGLR